MRNYLLRRQQIFFIFLCFLDLLMRGPRPHWAGRGVPCTRRERPHALHRGRPSRSFRHAEVAVVEQLEHAVPEVSAIGVMMK